MHIEFQEGRRLHRRAAGLNLKKHERIHQERLQVNSVTRAHHMIFLTACKRSRLASLKFPFALFLAATLVAPLRKMNENFS